MSKTGETESPKDSGKRGRPTLAEQLGKYSSGSQGSLLDSFNRKREEAEEERRRVEKELIENFQKARRVGRSPPQEATEGEGTESEGTEGELKDIKMYKLDRLPELVVTVKKDTQDIKKQNESINKEIRELKEEWKRKQEAWERE
ncbi:uncharacterized protein LOC123989227 [Osmia bicornis bicornis]|uniref:uncharacterized protein LOC123989227 n=1 Tax=Osmia bicornis bicornis TaxID=1437191 RepID=UPI001EAE8A4F|nr:uncharacterized protein LOC123989227 [Osmia bicornis bicornis]